MQLEIEHDPEAAVEFSVGTSARGGIRVFRFRRKGIQRRGKLGDADYAGKDIDAH